MILSPTRDNILQAAALIRGGELVAFPTETVYGLGGDATNPTAVAHIFEVKARPSFDPIIVHLPDHGSARDLAAEWPPAAELLARSFWPGPMTLIVRKRDTIPDIVTAGMDSVGLRVPDHPVARELLRQSRRPIAAPSANPFGYVSPTTAAHVAEQLGNQVPIILDSGPCRVGVESTIISLLDPRPVLLRPGGLPLEQIETLIGPVQIAPDSLPALAPGRLPSHYAPRTPFALVESVSEIAPARRSGAALIAVNAPADAAGFQHVEVLAPDGALATAAVNLFAALRRLDAGGFARIFAVRLPEDGLGRAIMDRLRRAAGPRG